MVANMSTYLHIYIHEFSLKKYSRNKKYIAMLSSHKKKNSTTNISRFCYEGVKI